MTDKVIQKIKDIIVDALEKDSRLLLASLEQTHPTWKGSAILSKKGSSLNTELIIGFNNKEAQIAETGTPAAPVKGTYIQTVKSHVRRTKQGSSRVSAHRRTYQNHKPIKLSTGDWIMVDEIPEVEATKPISKAVVKRFTGKSGEELLVEALKQYGKRL